MMKQRVMKPCRSALFVPGNKPSWVEKAVASGVDSLIIDLEDSVPVADKRSARLLVREALIALEEQGQHCSVRLNGLATGMTLDDLQSIMCPELTVRLWWPHIRPMRQRHSGPRNQRLKWRF